MFENQGFQDAQNSLSWNQDKRTCKPAAHCAELMHFWKNSFVFTLFFSIFLNSFSAQIKSKSLIFLMLSTHSRIV